MYMHTFIPNTSPHHYHSFTILPSQQIHLYTYLPSTLLIITIPTLTSPPRSHHPNPHIIPTLTLFQPSHHPTLTSPHSHIIPTLTSSSPSHHPTLTSPHPHITPPSHHPTLTSPPCSHHPTLTSPHPHITPMLTSSQPSHLVIITWGSILYMCVQPCSLLLCGLVMKTAHYHSSKVVFVPWYVYSCTRPIACTNSHM